MKLVYVSKALTVAAYRDKVRELDDRVDVTAVIPDRWTPAPEPTPAGLPEPERVPVRFPGNNHLHHYPGAARWLDRLAPDLVHVDEEPYSFVTYQLARLCWRRGLPWVFFAWQNLHRRLPPPFGHLRRAVFRMASGGIAGTDAAARVLRAQGFERPLRVIPQFGVGHRFAPDPQARARSRARLGLAADTFAIGYGGRLVREKGVHVLVHAFHRLRSGAAGGAPPVHLVIMGDGPERNRLEAALDDAPGRVRFLGRVPSVAMPETIVACDVMVLPSTGGSTWTEQFGRILVESMACGVPVVGSRCGEIPEVIGDAGETVATGDAEALAAALGRLRDSPALRARRAARGRARVADRYTQARIAGRTADFYHELLPAREAVP